MSDVVFLLVTALVGFVLSYVAVTALNIGGRKDESLNRDLQQMGLQMVGLVVTTVFIPLKGAWSTATDFATMSVQRWKWVVAMVLFTLATLVMHYYHHEVLSIIDDLWTCTIVPILRNIVTPLLQISRVFYAIAMPLVNAYLVIVGQIMNAWYITLAKCSHIKLFRIFTELTLAIKTFFMSLRAFFGADSVIDDTNNFYFNDFELDKPLNHTMGAVSVGQEVLACACKRFEPLFNFGFVVFQEPHVVAALDNFAQTGIRILQMIFRLLFPDIFPDVYLISFKAERAVMETGLSLDAILFKSLNNIVNMFDRDFKFTVYPEEALGAIAAHGLAAGLHTAATLMVNVPLHILGSFRADITPFDPSVWSLEPAFAHIHAGIYSSAVFIQWVVYLLERLMTDTVDIGKVFTSPDTPLDLSCDWARDVAQHKYVSIGYTAACSFYSGSTAFTNIYFIGYGLIVELLTKSLFTKEPQNIFRTLQRWEGPMLPRNKVYDCEARKAVTAYNYMTDTHNPDGWVWTQDISKCGCNRYYGTTRDEDDPVYNPWCGQMSVNFDVFAPLDAIVMHVSHGLLGPGFGDAFPFIDPIQDIEINIPQMGVEKSIALPMALPPITRTAIESVRVMMRVVLSFGDIATGHFFNYPSNCGHGLNMTQLQKKYETETKRSSENLLDEDMRWHTCKSREYSAVRGGKRTEVCQETNDDGSCMCSYVQALTPQSKCKCIARYPDLDVTSASQEVGDLIEKRFTSEDVAIHWCNSMLLEWTFQNTAAFADALDYMVSLAPINPTCDVVNRTLSGQGFDTESADQRSSSTYLIANTPTLNITNEFTSAMGKLNTMKSLYSQTRAGCAIKRGGIVPATDEDGQPVLDGDGKPVMVRTLDQWSCDASDVLVSIADIDPLDLSKKPGCRIWGRNDLFCSGGLFVRNFKRLTMNLARQVVNDGISMISGNFADVNVNTLPRLCDYERVFGSISSMIASVIPGIKKPTQEAFAKFINMGLQLYFVQGVRTVLTISNMVTTMVMDLVSGTLDKDSIEKTFLQGVDDIVYGLAWAFRYFWETTGEMLNAIKADSGAICFTIVDITDMIIDQLRKGLLDLIGLVTKTFFQFVAALNGDSTILTEMFENIGKIWLKVTELVLDQMWNILNAVLGFFKPVGPFFQLLATSICHALNTVVGFVKNLVRAGCLWQCEGFEWEMNCPDWKTSAKHPTNTPYRLGNHFLGGREDKYATKRIAEILDWSGNSVCDHFMSAAAEYAYTELRPLEKSKWFECLELKLIGMEIAKFIGSKSFPTDIMYNWKSKYAIAFDMFKAVKVLISHILSDEKFDWAMVRMAWIDIGLDSDMYMHLFTKTSQLGHSILKSVEMTSFLRFILGQIDPKFDQVGNPSNAATAWSVFTNIHQAYVVGTSEWTKKDATQQLWTAIDASYDAHIHLHSWWSALGTEQPVHETDTERVFSKLKRNIHHLNKEKNLKTKRPKHRPTWLRTPMRTGIKSCAERGNPGWCTDCNIADNLIETTLEQAEAIAEFYSGRFPKILNNVSDYFNQLGEYNKDFFEGTYSRLSSAAPKIPRTKERWLFHVAADWKNLGVAFWDFFTDVGNTTKRDLWLDQIEKVFVATRKFVTGTNSDYVPFFGYALYYSFDYTFFSKCDLAESIFVTVTTEEERLQQIDAALLGVFILALVIATNTTWSVIPLVWLANTVVIGALSSWLFLYMVYGYHLNCAPLLPYSLMDDFNAWYHSRIQPDCFYKFLPHLVFNATDDTCLTCSQPVIYQDCTVYTAANYTEGMLPLHELIEEYNIFWPALFWVRWQFPSIPTEAVRYGLLPFESVLGRLALGAWQQEPIDPVWIDCYHAMWLDNVLAAIIVAIVGYISFKLIFVTIQATIQVGILIGYAYTILSYMSLAIEQSVVIEGLE